VPATLRNNAGILGAASLALEPKVLPNANQLVGEVGEDAVTTR
jgi:polyphosphate glucokinase